MYPFAMPTTAPTAASPATSTSTAKMRMTLTAIDSTKFGFFISGLKMERL